MRFPPECQKWLQESLAAIWFDARSGIWRAVLAYKVYPISGLDNKNEEAQRIHRSRKGRYVIPKGGRTRCYMCRASICRCLPRQSQSPALSFAVSPCSPAAVVVKDVVPTESSRGAAPKPPHGSICIVTLMALKVKLFFPARRRSFPTCHCSARLRFAPVSERSRRIRFLAQVNICAA